VSHTIEDSFWRLPTQVVYARPNRSVQVLDLLVIVTFIFRFSAAEGRTPKRSYFDESLPPVCGHVCYRAMRGLEDVIVVLLLPVLEQWFL